MATNLQLKEKHTLLEDLEELAETDTLTSFDDMSRPLLKDATQQVRYGRSACCGKVKTAKLVPNFPQDHE